MVILRCALQVLNCMYLCTQCLCGKRPWEWVSTCLLSSASAGPVHQPKYNGQPAVTSGLHVRSKLTCHLYITPDRVMSYIRHQFLIERRRFSPFQCVSFPSSNTFEVLGFWEENRWLRWAGLTASGWWNMGTTICLRGSPLSPTTNCLLYWNCHYSPNFFWLSEKVMFMIKQKNSFLKWCQFDNWSKNEITHATSLCERETLKLNLNSSVQVHFWRSPFHMYTFCI